MKTKTYKN